MSYQTLMQVLSPHKPLLNINYAILSAPVRHLFMMATLWHLTRKGSLKDLHVLEIGSWYGASTLSWAQGLKLHNGAQGRITCIDAWVPFFNRNKHQDDVYIEMEKSLEADVAYNVFLHNIKTIPSSITCQHLRGQSENILPVLKDQTFDVVFIDGDHTYKAVKRDIENSLRLVKDGGIICGDDLNLQLHECDAEAAEKNADCDFVKDPKTNRNFHPGVTLAVAELLGEVSVYGGFWLMQKQGNAWVKVSFKNMPIHYPEHFPPEAIAKAEDHLKDIVGIS